MFKEPNRIWLYLVGIVILMVLLLLVGRDYVLPIIKGQRSVLQPAYIYLNAPSFSLDTTKDYRLRLQTNYGTMVVDLYEQDAPKNVNNVVFLASQGYYNGTKFHRLFKDLLVQGGDRNTLNGNPDDDGRGGPGYFIDDEVNWDNLGLDTAKRTELTSKGYNSTSGLSSHPLEKFAIAMANSQPNSNGSQFFIVTARSDDNRLQQMNGYFTVVGRIISGAEVLEAINKVEVNTTNPNLPRPTTDITLQSVEVLTL